MCNDPWDFWIENDIVFMLLHDLLACLCLSLCFGGHSSGPDERSIRGSTALIARPSFPALWMSHLEFSKPSEVFRFCGLSAIFDYITRVSMPKSPSQASYSLSGPWNLGYQLYPGSGSWKQCCFVCYVAAGNKQSRRCCHCHYRGPRCLTSSNHSRTFGLVEMRFHWGFGLSLFFFLKRKNSF